MLNIRKTNKNTRRKRSRTGVVAAEMAVVLPVFLIVFFGFIEVARLSFAVNSTQEFSLTWRQFRTPSTEQLRVAASKRTSPIKLTGEPLIVALIYDN